MDRVRSDNMQAVVVRESYSLLRPKIELFGNETILFSKRMINILPFCGILLQLLVWVIAGFLAGVCLE